MRQLPAGEGQVPGGDAEPDRGDHGAGDGVVDVGPQVTALVVYRDAALAGQVVSVPHELLDRGDAIADGEHVVDLLLQGERVDGGGGPAAGDGLPRLDGAEVKEVAHLSAAFSSTVIAHPPGRA